MDSSGLVNVLCENEFIMAQIVDPERDLYRSLNITMGEVNIFDIIRAKKNEDGVLELIKIEEEGLPHKSFFTFKDQEDWTKICIESTKFKDQCIIQGLATPKNKQPGMVVMAYVDGFDPSKEFGDLVSPVE